VTRSVNEDKTFSQEEAGLGKGRPGSQRIEEEGFVKKPSKCRKKCEAVNSTHGM